MPRYILSFLLLFFVLNSANAQIKINSSGKVAMGTNPGSDYRLLVSHINNDATAVGLKAVASGAFYSYGIQGISNGGGDYSYGAYGKAEGALLNYGIYGEASNTNAFNYGLYGKAENGFMLNYGVRGSASGADSYGGYFTGGLYVSGGITQASDERLKKNIRAINIEDISAKVSQLRPQRYEFLSAAELKQKGMPVSHIEEGEHFGLLAQDLEKIFPELVTDVVHVLNEPTDPRQRTETKPQTVTTKAINYQELTVLLLAAVQELQARVEVLEAERNKN